ncbi:MAG TPA: nucleoside 2-deoxyribosyltransferase domain-containing protein [Streptosporangiaceae bacterium]|jgi:8-oxo-dGTP pyrophosphatase MutT (NUDIX family)
MITVVYAGDQPPDSWDASLFLAGPTPRSPDVASWRPAALQELDRLWSGPGRLVVFVPEAPGGGMVIDADEQVAWEDRWLNGCDAIAFWVPRSADLPGFTTNVEWGRWEGSGKVVLGAPPDAVRMTYLRRYATKHGAPTSGTLRGTLRAALALLGDGARRAGPHREIPLPLWRTPSFRQWLTAQERAGNTLRAGRVEWTWRCPGLFYWAYHPALEVNAEGRVKGNEVVLSRPDIATVVAYRRGATPYDTEVVLVREFRCAAVTGDGFVREPPGGSGPGGPRDQAAAELAEETGLVIDPGRLRTYAARQAMATMSAHRHHVFGLELTGEELDRLHADDSVHGDPVSGGEERTTVEIHTLGELLSGDLVDWTTVGILAQVLLGPK